MGKVYGFLLDRGTARQSQMDALISAGCGEIWFKSRFTSDLISGLTKGDRLLVWRIDELDLSIQGVVEMISRLKVQGIEFGALVDGIDTVRNKEIQEFCLALATMRQRSHSQRVTAGIERARAAGQRVGRGRKLTPSDVEIIHASIRSGEVSVRAAAREFGISRNTLQRYLSEARSQLAIAEGSLTEVQKTMPAKRVPENE